LKVDALSLTKQGDSVMSIIIKLREEEVDAIMHQEAVAESGGEFQQLLEMLQNQVSNGNNELALSEEDVQQFRHYAADSNNPGINEGLQKLFNRVLDQNVDEAV
jgi:hypothetical protein